MEKKAGRPVLWSVLFTAVLAVVLVAAVLVANYFGIGTMRSAFRVGYFGTESRQCWSASYTLLSGWMRRTLYPEGDVLQVEVQTEAGTLSMEMWDGEGNLIFSQQDMNGVYQVPAAGKVVVKITAQDHRGIFSIKRPVAADNAHGDGPNRSICWARPVSAAGSSSQDAPGLAGRAHGQYAPGWRPVAADNAHRDGANRSICWAFPVTFLRTR